MQHVWRDPNGPAMCATAQAVLAALAQVGLAAVTLDRQGRALDANAAVSLGDGLDVVASRPRASHPDDQAALDAAIHRAVSADGQGASAAAQRVTLRRPSGRRPLLVSAVPLPSTTEPGPVSPAAASALMVITDLDACLPLETAELRRVFGLTPREAEFAASLATGAPLDAAARTLGISLQHARQRLKALFRKTGTHRQGELVALLSRLRAGGPSAAGEGGAGCRI